jgi:long-subunit fatty acid transport protein
MSKKILAIFFLIVGLVPLVWAQRMTPILEQVIYGDLALGKEARIWGMGGASLAVPSDALPSSWNPAGLASLSRPAAYLSFSQESLSPKTREDRSASPFYGTTASVSIRELESSLNGRALDFAAFALPLKISGFRLAAQLSYSRQVPYSFDIDCAYQYRYQSYYRFDYDYQYKASPTGGFDLLTLSLAAEVFRGVSVGFHIHRWSNGFDFQGQESYQYSIENYFGWSGEWTEEYGDRCEFKISGLSLDVGILFNFSHRLFAGLVFRSGCRTHLQFSNNAEYRNSHSGEDFNQTGSGAGEISFPASIGLGVSIHAAKNLLLAADYVRTLWSRARIRDYVRTSSGPDSPEPRDYTFPSMTPPEIVGQKDASQLHGGVEYVSRIGSVGVPLRCGFFFDEHYFYGDSGEKVTSAGYTLGLGLRWNNVAIDTAWVKAASRSRFVRNSLRVSLSLGF